MENSITKLKIMPKYARTYVTQLSLLFVFLTMCIVGCINYGAELYITVIPIVVVFILSLVVTINYLVMSNKNIKQWRFTIKKNKHFSRWAGIPKKSVIPMGKSVFHIFMDGPGLEYNFNNSHNNAINKIFGESYGTDHHENSMRIGWNFDPYVNMFSLYLYGYKDGTRVIEHLRSFDVNAFKNLSFYLYIYKTKGNVYVEIRDHELLDSKFGKTFKPSNIEKKSWMLRPYFGGQMKSQGEINTHITRVS